MTAPEICPNCGANINGVVCTHCGRSLILKDYGYEIRRARQGLNLYINGASKLNFSPRDKEILEKLKELIDAPAEIIEQAIAEALEFEEDKGDKFQVNESVKNKEIDEETKAKAITLLQDPAFFYKLGAVMEHGFRVPKINRIRFLTAEERNKRLMPLLIGAASKLGLTSIIRLIGGVGTGKARAHEPVHAEIPRNDADLYQLLVNEDTDALEHHEDAAPDPVPLPVVPHLHEVVEALHLPFLDR